MKPHYLYFMCISGDMKGIIFQLEEDIYKNTIDDTQVMGGRTKGSNDYTWICSKEDLERSFIPINTKKARLLFLQK